MTDEERDAMIYEIARLKDYWDEAEAEATQLKEYWDEAEAEILRLRCLLDLYRAAAVVSPTMDGPIYTGCNSSALRRAWEADTAARKATSTGGDNG